MSSPRWFVWVAPLLIGWWSLVAANETATKTEAAPETPAHKYVGAKKCKTCHNSEKGGAQYRIWSESKHAKAFEVLASEKAKEIGKEKGIADPQKADECLQCHVTGHGEPAERFGPAFAAAEGVGCETCHGAGSDYIKMKTMQGLRDGTLKAEAHGLKAVTKETCAHCHNEKGTGGKFVEWPSDSAKIAHAIPPGYKRGSTAAEGTEK